MDTTILFWLSLIPLAGLARWHRVLYLYYIEYPEKLDRADGLRKFVAGPLCMPVVVFLAALSFVTLRMNGM